MAAQSAKPELSYTWKLTAVLRDEVYKDVELTNAVCGDITDKRHTSKLVRELNTQYPLQNLLHLKRVRASEEGANLSILISASSDEIVEEQILTLEHSLQQNQKIIGIGKLHMVKVPRWKPITRKQFNAAIKYWPTHFHEDKRLEKMLRSELFSQEQLAEFEKFMKMAIEEATSAKAAGMAVVGAVVVDPVCHRVIAHGHSDHNHTLKHAVMVSIDNVAAGQGGGAWRRSQPGRLQQGSSQHTVAATEGSLHVPGACGSSSGSYSESDSPPAPKKCKQEKQYLCTGYDVYTTKEPCIITRKVNKQGGSLNMLADAQNLIILASALSAYVVRCFSWACIGVLWHWCTPGSKGCSMVLLIHSLEAWAPCVRYTPSQDSTITLKSTKAF